jgi:hypothetical protein
MTTSEEVEEKQGKTEGHVNPLKRSIQDDKNVEADSAPALLGPIGVFGSPKSEA